MIPFSNPKAQYLSHKTEIEQAISDTLDSGWYILGQQVRLFEKEFADYIGSRFAIGVGSGTEAIHLALKAIGIVPGDEVITVSHTAVATVSAIELAGASPVLADIEYDYFTIDPSKIEPLISVKTKAIIPVHLYGQPAEMNEILSLARKYNLYVVEDCAQSHGAFYHGKRVGSIGDISCFSFYPTKNLGAIGDGGAVVTDNSDLAERVRLLREYGWAQRYLSDVPGWNSRLDEIQAAVLRAKLRTLDYDNQRRSAMADLYGRGLMESGLAIPVTRKDVTHVFHLYVVRSPEREKIIRMFTQRNIGFGIHYPVPIHLQRAYKGRLGLPGKLSITEQFSNEIFSLPMYPELSETECNEVIAAIKDAINN